MEAIEITVEERSEKGKGSGNRLRRSGKVPAVVYAGGKPSQMVVLDQIEFNRQIDGKRLGQLYKFKSSSKELGGQLALVKEIQMEPIKDKVLHLDFIAVDALKPIKVTVALETTGESPSVKLGEAVLNVSVHEIEIECLPTSIPSSIAVDISQLTLGTSIHARDLKLPEGVTLRSDPELTLVSAIQKRAEEEAAPAAATAAAPETAAPAVAAPAKK